MSWNCPFLFAESTIPIAVIHDVKEKCAGFPHIPFGLMICFAIISETWLFASGFWVEIPFEVELVLGMYWTEGSETLMNVTKKYLSFWDGQKFRSLFKFKALLVSMHILFVLFFCVCLLQTGTKFREFIWSSVPFNDASGPSFKHTPTTNSAAQVISTQKAEPKKDWKRVGFRNLNILRWHYQWKWLELWIQQGRIGIFISFTSSRITTRVLQPSKTKLSGWQTSKLPEQVVPVAAVHKIVSLSIWSWDVMKPEPFLGLSPLRCLLMLAILEPFLNAVLTPKDSVTLLLRIQNLKTKKWVFKKI